MTNLHPMHLCIHGHFYQPPRENPWTGEYEAQESALPHHDWNERIARECYAPNGASRLLDARGRIRGLVNNYRWMSFNFGPTLLEWMASHDPETLARIQEADRKSSLDQGGHGNAVAQVYNHIIMPLGTDRDRKTQIAWGIREFQDRFGRVPEGMWLAETAIDIQSVVALIQAGIRFTILAPTQADRIRPMGSDVWQDVSDSSIDPTRPYRIYPLDENGEPLCAGHLDVFFYDGPISSAVGFEHLLRDAQVFHQRLKGAWAADELPRLVSVGTDGESYGHHEPFGDMALAYLFDVLIPEEGIVPTNFGRFLDLRPPVEEVRLKNAHGEGTAWSCAHGTGRWQRDCGCSTGGGPGWNQAWRTPLREAMELARNAAEKAWDTLASTLFLDPWAARIDWISIRTGRLDRAAWEGRHLVPGADRRKAHQLMELVRMGQFSLTSCAWFFDDLGGLEPVQNMRYALRVCELCTQLGLPSPEPWIRDALARGRSNVGNRTGEWIWENWVVPSSESPRRVAAQAAVRAAEGLGVPSETTNAADVVRRPRDGFAEVRVELRDPVGGDPIHFRAVSHTASGESARAWILEGEGPFPEVSWDAEAEQLRAHLASKWSGEAIEASRFDLDTRRELAEGKIRSSLEEIQGDLESLDQHARRARADLLQLNLPLPTHLSFARTLLLEKALAEAVLAVLQNPAVEEVSRIRSILSQAQEERLDLRVSLPGRIVDRKLQDLMVSLWPTPQTSDAATLVLLLDLAEEAKIPVSKAPLENLASHMMEEHLHPLLRQSSFSAVERECGRLWVIVLERLNFDMDLAREILEIPVEVSSLPEDETA
ncbi:MAG: DUF3536 domain-containing protein [Fibrobacteria bacterium]|nr:DUF3536 domain-containing protein [Fibrobacteria bacterium]